MRLKENVEIVEELSFMGKNDADDVCTTHIARPLRGAAQSRERLPCLLMVSGERTGELIPLEAAETVAGRGSRADIHLDFDSVSRLHARFVRHPNGQIDLVDLGSTNGTYVDGAPIERVTLKDGDTIGLGDVEAFRFGRYAENEKNLQHQLYLAATRDGLTDVLNRRHFMLRLRQEFQLALRTGDPLCVSMIDIDYFKQVNDRHGHATGDRVLRGVAGRIRKQLRSYDLVGRYGGEEFSLVLRHTDPEQALQVVDRVRLSVAQEPLDAPTDAEGRVEVTISVGLASLDVNHIHTPEALLELADQALYLAKQSGRNRVMCHGEQAG
ncbi:MAG: GGDEF domain-containing protein [Proteobacteria bacterium]|nr:GGDEF domain-containing protein [Pseudomonadota bacterium]